MPTAGPSAGSQETLAPCASYNDEVIAIETTVIEKPMQFWIKALT